MFATSTEHMNAQRDGSRLHQMRVKLQADNQFGDIGPQKGTLGRVHGFTQSCDDESDIMFFCSFDDYPHEFYWLSPKHVATINTQGSISEYQWFEWNF